ncbi:MAG: hypothetical protein U0572_07230 [Phycisphaerales bacterium]
MVEPVDPVIEDARAFLRSHLSGLLRFDGEHRPLKVVIAPDGRLVAPVMVAMIRSLDTTLCLPDDDDESLHLQVSLEQFEERAPHAALADRWRIYHGDPPDVRWAMMKIDAGRFDGLFIDGDALTCPNSLSAIEPAICKSLNASHVDLVRAACLAHAKIGIEKPRVVGVDDMGFDVRGTFDVVRLAAPAPLRNESDALAALQRLARG